MDAEGFTGKIVGVVIAVIVVAAVAVPIVADLTKEGSAVTGTTKTILGILPVFLVLAILMIVVRMFMNKSE